MFVLHGGPIFNHRYLLPEIDRLAASSTLVLYDQRGRGRSAAGIQPADVDISAEIDDLDTVRTHLGFDRIAVAGHSWGGLLAAEYTLRHRQHVSHLILMNSAPLSHRSFLRFRSELAESRPPEGKAELLRIAAAPEYQRGDLAAARSFNRIYFRSTIKNETLLADIVDRMVVDFTPATLTLARAIGDRLDQETWMSPDYDLLPQLGQLAVPILVLHGEHDLIPGNVAAEIASSSTTAQLQVLEGCGHFAFAEKPDQVAGAISTFVAG